MIKIAVDNAKVRRLFRKRKFWRYMSKRECRTGRRSHSLERLTRRYGDSMFFYSLGSNLDDSMFFCSLGSNLAVFVDCSNYVFIHSLILSPEILSLCFNKRIILSSSEREMICLWSTHCHSLRHSVASSSYWLIWMEGSSLLNHNLEKL